MSGVNLSTVGPLKKKLGARRQLPAGTSLLFYLSAASLFICECIATAQTSSQLATIPPPPDAQSEWKLFLGDFRQIDGTEVLIVHELNGKLYLLKPNREELELTGRDLNSFSYDGSRPDEKYVITFIQSHGIATSLLGPFGSYQRLPYEQSGTANAVIKTVRPVEELRAAAIAAAPPAENRALRESDLVELAPLDPAIHLDIRYATSNDFLGVAVYTQARAFLQRPAAEALLRVLHKLHPLGYGLLIHDGYRPWYVTKIFWDATPFEGKIFVADPAQGSRHNRGCAVDLTLYELETGRPVEMTGGYDEMSPRSFPNYPGGTSLQRWHRDLLRRAMESEGFTVYESEWWHFDYKEWREYGILNIPFEKLGIGSRAK